MILNYFIVTLYSISDISVKFINTPSFFQKLIYIFNPKICLGNVLIQFR